MNNNSEQGEIKSQLDDRFQGYRGLILLFSLVVTVQVLIGFAIYFGIEQPEQRGMFGDMFGVVNTLFAGLAFAGVIYAIILQSKELEMQRLVLEATREELSKSASAHAEAVSVQQKSMLEDHKRRKNQATIEYMAMIRPVWKKTRRALNDTFGTDSLTEKDIEKILSDKSLQRKIRDMLGWLEHLALGVNIEVYDEKTVYQMSGSNLIRIYTRMRLYISTAQTGNPQAYIHLVHLIRNFEERRRLKPITNSEKSLFEDDTIVESVRELEEQD